MAAEIVVVFKQQDAGIRAELLLAEPGRRQATDAGTDDDHVVLLVGFFDGVGGPPAPGQCMRGLE